MAHAISYPLSVTCTCSNAWEAGKCALVTALTKEETEAGDVAELAEHAKHA